MFTLKICVRIFSGCNRARILALGLHTDDELWYGVRENLALCSFTSPYLSIILSFQNKGGVSIRPIS